MGLEPNRQVVRIGSVIRRPFSILYGGKGNSSMVDDTPLLVPAYISPPTGHNRWGTADEIKFLKDLGNHARTDLNRLALLYNYACYTEIRVNWDGIRKWRLKVALTNMIRTELAK